MGEVRHKTAAVTGSPARESELRRQVSALQAQLAAETQSYRTIIATMAATCRSLQERIRVLEAERHNSDGRERLQRRRETWHASRIREELPAENERSASKYVESCGHVRSGTAGKEGTTEITSRIQVVFDDAALLQKAWSWF